MGEEKCERHSREMEAYCPGCINEYVVKLIRAFEKRIKKESKQFRKFKWHMESQSEIPVIKAEDVTKLIWDSYAQMERPPSTDQDVKVELELRDIEKAFESWPKDLREWIDTHRSHPQAIVFRVATNMVKRNYPDEEVQSRDYETLVEIAQAIKEWWEKETIINTEDR